MHHGEPSGANVSIKGAQDSGNSEPMAINKGEFSPRGPGPSGECPGFEMLGVGRAETSLSDSVSLLGDQPSSQAASPMRNRVCKQG